MYSEPILLVIGYIAFCPDMSFFVTLGVKSINVLQYDAYLPTTSFIPVPSHCFWCGRCIRISPTLYLTSS